VNSVSTVDLLDKEPTLQAPTSGVWRESYERESAKAFDLSRLAKAVGFAFSLAISPVTAMPDPWLMDKRRRDAVVTVSIYQELIGRPISRSEALRIARQILEQAEQERLAIAEFEAARGIHWGTSHDL